MVSSRCGRTEMTKAATCARNDDPVAYSEVGALEGAVNGETLATSVRRRQSGGEGGLAYRAEDGSGIFARNAIRDGYQVVDPSDLEYGVCSERK